MLTPFSPPPGINSDDTTFSAQGRWVASNNVRFFNGRPQVINPFATLFTLGSTVYNMFAWSRSGTTHVAYGRSANVMVGSGIASPTDRTPVGMGSGYTAYAFAPWGSTLLFVPSGKTLYEQSGTSTATEVTQAPDKITWMLTTPERQVLAFGCNEESSGTFNPLCIRGCDIEDYTDWTTSATNNAFEHILDDGGEIVTARLIGTSVAVWTKSDLHLGQFVGDPTQTYRFDHVADNCGTVGPNAVVVVGQTAFWLGNDHRVRAWSPGAEVITLPCPVFNEMDAALSGSGPTVNNLIVLANVSKFNEIWIYLSSQYYAFSIDAPQIWFAGEIERSAALTNELLVSPMGTAYGTNIITTAAGVVYATECQYDVASPTGPLEWSIQSADQYADDGQRRTLIRGIVPDLRALTSQSVPGSISLTLYVRDRPQSTAVTKGPYTLSVSASKKDFRASGKVVALKFSGGASTFVRLGKQEFDIVAQGQR